MQANNSTTNTSANAALNPTSSSSAAATASSSASVPASRPLQWPTGLTVHQQQRFQAEFERKRKEMEVQQKRLQAELQANHRAQLVRVLVSFVFVLIEYLISMNRSWLCRHSCNKSMTVQNGTWPNKHGKSNNKLKMHNNKQTLVITLPIPIAQIQIVTTTRTTAVTPH